MTKNYFFIVCEACFPLKTLEGLAKVKVSTQLAKFVSQVQWVEDAQSQSRHDVIDTAV